MLIVLCIYFQGKIKFSHCIWSIYLFRILIFICSAILLSRMKLLFFSLWKFAKLLMLFCKAQVSFPSNFASIFSAIKYNSSILFLAQTLYTLVKSNLLKCKFLRFSSARVKICQIPHVNFELTSQFLFKFCIILHCHDT